MRTLWIVEPNVNSKGWVARWQVAPRDEWNWVRERVFVPTDEPNVLQYRDDIEVYPTRAKAIKETAETCRRNWEGSMRELSELRVRRKDGQWSKETRTYGKDPVGNG